jgi:hypothetical protein
VRNLHEPAFLDRPRTKSLPEDFAEVKPQRVAGVADVRQFPRRAELVHMGSRALQQLSETGDIKQDGHARGQRAEATGWHTLGTCWVRPCVKIRGADPGTTRIDSL